MTKKEMFIWGIVILLFTIVVIYPRPRQKEPAKEPGTITNVGPNYIEVEAYGRFLINPKEAAKLNEGEHAPKYILERGS
jgi:hypothetical protein|nr:MAG TPA: Protein of unknown function (DUF1372) [Caudoviricetes sp.]